MKTQTLLTRIFILIFVSSFFALTVIIPTHAQDPTPPPAATPLPVTLPGPVPDSLTLAREMFPEGLVPGQENEITLTLTGQNNAACWGIPGGPVDVVLVFDISTSAGVGPGSNWEHTVGLTQALLKYLALPIYQSPTGTGEFSQTAIITSQTGPLGPEPLLLQPLSSDYPQLQNLVTNLTPEGDTDIVAGLNMAAEVLTNAATGHTKAIFLMLHDNTALKETVGSAINAVRGQGIDVYLVVNSLNLDPGEQITEDIAIQYVPRNLVYLDPDANALYDLFLGATGGDDTLAAANVRLVERLAPAEQIALTAISGPTGRIETSQAVWDAIAIGFGKTVDLGYQMRVNADASGPLSIEDELQWLDCNGQPQMIIIPVIAGPLTPVTPASETSTPPAEGPEPQPDATEEAITFPEVGTDTGIGLAGDTVTVPGLGIVLPALLPALGEIGNLLLWLLLILLLLLLFLALLWMLWHWWLNKQNKFGPVEKPGIRIIKDPPVQFDLLDKIQPGASHNWISRIIHDQHGRAFTLSTRRDKLPTDIGNALGRGESPKFRVRVNEKNNEQKVLGQAEMGFDRQEARNLQTGKMDTWHRARIDTLEITDRQSRRHRLGTAMLSEMETYTRESGGREIYGLLKPGAWPFFEKHGYQRRTNTQGEAEVYKSFVQEK